MIKDVAASLQFVRVTPVLMHLEDVVVSCGARTYNQVDQALAVS